MKKDYERMDEVERFVFKLWDGSIAYNELYSLKMAEDDLQRFRQEWEDDVPEDITPRLLMDIWNDFVLSSCEMVLNTDNQCVPRTSEMDNRQIADVIERADSWDEVKDLVNYVDEMFLHLEKDEDGYYTLGWDRAVEDWCDNQR